MFQILVLEMRKARAGPKLSLLCAVYGDNPRRQHPGDNLPPRRKPHPEKTLLGQVRTLEIFPPVT